MEPLEQRVLFSADLSTLIGADLSVPVEEDGWAAVDSGDIFDTDARRESLSGATQNDQTAPGAVQSLAVPASAATTLQPTVELLVIDTSIKDYQQLLRDIEISSDTSLRVIELEADRDGITQISDHLSGLSNVTAIHIISHGADGVLELGNSTLSNSNISKYQDQLQSWQTSMNQDADILLYGCDLAAGPEGIALLDAIQDYCDCDVAASTDTTGHAGADGNWTLEYQSGAVEAALPLTQSAVNNWPHTLDITSNILGQWTFDGNAEDSSTTNNNGIFTAPYYSVLTGGQNITADFSEDATGPSYVLIPDNSAYDFDTSDFTISLWYTTSVTPTTDTVLFQQTDANSSITIELTANGTTRVILESGGFSQWWTMPGTNDGDWHLVSLVKENSTYRPYFDQLQASSSSLSPFNPSAPISVGADASGANEFDGLIDDLRIYSTALTPVDIDDLYTTTQPATPLETVVVDTGADYAVTDTNFGTTTSISALKADKGSDGLVSLREAVTAANSTAGNIGVVLGNDNYLLTVTGDAEQNAARGDLDINSPLTITGTGPGESRITGAMDDRLFELRSGNSLTLNNLSLNDGNGSNYSGGAVHVPTGTSLAATSVVFNNNSADGTNGGAIYAQGSVTVDKSTFTQNHAGNGGAIFVTDGSASVTNSTFTGNASEFAGGAIYAYSGTVNANFNTISGNDATNSKGGGIAKSNSASATLNVTNSIIAGNTAMWPTTGSRDINPGLDTSGYNIIQDDELLTLSASDQGGVDPKLYPFVIDPDSGQGVFPIDATSPAYESASFGPTEDQRGEARIAPLNIGSFEGSIPSSNSTNTGPVNLLNTGGGAIIGGSMPLTKEKLHSYDADDSPADLTYTITAITNGRLELSTNPGVAVTTFSQADINANLVSFVHDGLSQANSSFDFIVQDGGENFAAAISDTFVIYTSWTTADQYATDQNSTLMVTNPASGLLSNDAPSQPGYPVTLVSNFNAGSDSTDPATWESALGNFDLALSNATYVIPPANPIPGIEAAFEFSGVSSGATAPALDSFNDIDGTKPATLEAWINLDALSGNNMIFDTGDGNPGVSVLVSGNSLILAAANNGNTKYDSTTGVLTAGTWHHVAVTISPDSGNDSVEVYVDGVKTLAVDRTLPNWASGAFGLGTTNGGSAGGYSGDFAGQLAHFRIYDAKLQASDIASLALNPGGYLIDPVVNNYNPTGLSGTVGVFADGTLTYSPDGLFDYLGDGETANDTFSYTYRDATGNLISEQATIVITGVNDAPVLSTIEANPAYFTENGSVGITGNLTIADVDNADIHSATLTISGNHSASQDALSFLDTAKITGAFDSAAGNLTLTGQASVAEYEAAIHSVQYLNSSDNPSVLTRTVDITVNDGSADSLPKSRAIEILPVNDAPLLTNIETSPANFVEPGPPQNITTGLSVFDLDDINITSATVAIITNHQPAEDILTFTDTTNITGSFDAAAGILTLTGPDTVANFEAAIRTVLYSNTENNPSTATRTIEITAYDDDVASGTAVRDIEITPYNDPPVLSSIEASPAYYVEQNSPIGITGNLIVTDVDTTIESATVAISNNLDADNDRLGFSQPGFTSSYDNNTGVLTISGTNTPAAYQAALRTVTFESTTNNPSLLTRTVEFVVHDGESDSAPLSRPIDIVPVNDSPTVAINNGAITTVGGTAIIDNTLLNEGDPDDAGAGLTYSVTGTTNGSVELSAAPGVAVTSFTQTDIDNGLLRFIHDGLTTQNGSFSFTLTDGGEDGSTPAADTFEVTITGAVPDAYSTNEDTVLSITDPGVLTNDTNTPGAIVTAFDNTATAGTVSVDANGGFQYDPDNAFDYLNQGQSALDTFNYTFDSSAGIQQTVTVEISIDGINDTPTINSVESSALSFTEDAAPTAVSNTLIISDIDDTLIEGARVVISGNYVPTEDLLVFNNQGSISGSFDSGNGELTLTGTATVAQYQAALRSVAYQNTSDSPVDSTRTVSFYVNDGDIDSAQASRLVSPVNVNDPPSVATNVGAISGVGQSTAITNAELNSSDPDDDGFGLIYTITGTSNGQMEFALNPGTPITSFTQAHLDAGSLRFVHDGLSIQNGSFDFVLSDGQEDGAPSQSGTFTITVIGPFDDAYSTVEGTAMSIGATGLLLNDTPTATGPFVMSFDDTTTIGTVSVNPDGGFSYQPGNNFEHLNTGDTATDSFEYVYDDGLGRQQTATVTITITGIDNAPVLSTIEAAAASFVEDGSPVGITGNLQVGDIDDTLIQSATLSISNNFIDTEDELLFTDLPGITGSFDSNIGVLSLNGPATVADFQAAIRTVSYNNTNNDNPDTSIRTVSITIADNTNISNTLSREIEILPTNDAPVLSSLEPTPVTFIENNGATELTDTLVLSDVDSTQIDSATISISANHQADEDELVFTDQSSITGSYDDISGVMTLSGAASLADYQAAIRSVSYNNTSEDPNTLNRGVSIQVSDGIAASNALTRDIEILPVNDAPQLSTIEATAATFTENGNAVGVTVNLQVDDIDDTLIQSARVTIANTFVSTEDELLFTDLPGITGGFDENTGTLTLTGPATLADFQSALRSVEYRNTSEQPTGVVREIDFTVSDGQADSNTVSRQVTLISINDAPVISYSDTTPATYIENAAPVPIASTFTLTDVDSNTMDNATIVLSSNYLPAEDVLLFTSQAGISGSFDSATGTLSLSGTASLADYESAIRTITYQNSSEAPNTAIRTVTAKINDGTLDSNSISRDINIVPVNDSPTLASIEPAAALFTEGSVGIGITGSLTIADEDDTSIEFAEIRISGNYDPTEDSLEFTNQSGISGLYNPQTGLLSLNGTASVSDYETAIQSINFITAGDDPSTLSRTISIVVNDGDSYSNLAFREIDIIAVNDAPVLSTSIASPLTLSENDPATVVLPDLLAGDPDNTLLSQATVAISGGFISNEDQLIYSGSVPGITANYDSGTGMLLLSGNASVSDYQAALRSVSYDNTSLAPSTQARTISFTVNDGSLSSNVLSRVVSVLPVDNSPTIANIEATPLLYNENDPPLPVTASISLADVDSAVLQSASIGIIGNFNITEDLLEYSSQNGIIGSFDNTTGILELSGAASVADYQTAIQSVTYRNSSDYPQVSSRTVEIHVNDGTTESNIVQRQLDVLPVNDAPVLSSLESTSLIYVENSTPVSLSDTLVAADADNTQLSSATIVISGNSIATEDVLTFSAQSGITGSYDASTATLSLIGTASVSDYQAALRSVSYHNTSDDPSPLTRTLTLSVDDSNLSSNVLQRDIQIIPQADAPFIDGIESTIASYTENSPPIVISSTIQLTDSDSAQLSGATVSFGNSYVIDEDLLVFSDQSGITGSFDNSTGVLTLTGSASVADYQLALQSVRYLNTSEQPTESPRLLQFNVSDVETGGLSQSSNEVSRYIDIKPVNDPPSSSDALRTTLEDTPYTLETTDFSFSDMLDDNEFTGIIVNTPPAQGTLLLAGLEVTANQFIDLADISAGNLTFTPSANDTGTSYGRFEFSVVDSGGTLHGGENSSAAQQIEFNVISVSDAPQAADTTIPVRVDTTHTLTREDFSFSDPADNDDFVSITITSSPALGSLTLAGVDANTGSTIPIADIDAGLLQYTAPSINAIDAPTGDATLGFIVDDSGSNTNGGATSSTTSNRVQFDVYALNQPPELIIAGKTVDEGSDNPITEDDLTATDPNNPADELVFSITALPAHGQLTLNGAALNTDDTFTLEQLQQNQLRYQHNGSETSEDFFSILLTDGGVDGVAPVSGTFALTINEILDQPPAIEDDKAFVKFAEAFDTAGGSALESGSVVLSVPATDNSTYQIAIVDHPDHGELTLRDDGTFRYLHDGSVIVQDSFSYSVTSDDGITLVATVQIEIEPPLSNAFDSTTDTISELAVPAIQEAFTETGDSEDKIEQSNTQESTTETTNNLEKIFEQTSVSPHVDDENTSPSEVIDIETNNIQTQALTTLHQRNLTDIEIKKHNKISYQSLGSQSVTFSTIGIEILEEVTISRPADVVSNESFVRGLDRLGEDLQSTAEEENRRYRIANDTAIGVSFGTTAGILAWLLRGGALFASAMASTPLWSSIDPVKVVGGGSRDEETTEDAEVENLFDD